MTLLGAIANMENGIEIDRFLYEIMVIWSAVHELEIDMLLQIYETIVDGKDQKKLSYNVFLALLHELFNCPDEICLQEYLNHTNTNDIMDKDAFIEACLNCRWKFEHEIRSKLCFVTNEDDINKLLKSKRMISQLLLRSSEFLSVNNGTRSNNDDNEEENEGEED